MTKEINAKLLEKLYDVAMWIVFAVFIVSAFVHYHNKKNVITTTETTTNVMEWKSDTSSWKGGW